MFQTTGLRDHRTTGPRDYGTTGPRDYRSTGPGRQALVRINVEFQSCMSNAGANYCGTTGLRDYETTGPKIQAEEKIQTAECAEYAQKWSAFARFVYSAVLWPFYFGGTAQFLATKCKKGAKTLDHGFPGWHGWGRQMEDGRGERGEGRQKTANRRCEQEVLRRSEV